MLGYFLHAAELCPLTHEGIYEKMLSETSLTDHLTWKFGSLQQAYGIEQSNLGSAGAASRHRGIAAPIYAHPWQRKPPTKWRGSVRVPTLRPIYRQMSRPLGEGGQADHTIESGVKAADRFRLTTRTVCLHYSSWSIAPADDAPSCFDC